MVQLSGVHLCLDLLQTLSSQLEQLTTNDPLCLVAGHLPMDKDSDISLQTAIEVNSGLAIY